MNLRSIVIRSASAAAICFALLTNVGYAKLNWHPSKYFGLNSTWPFHDKDEPIEGTPTRLTATWADTVMTQPGKKPVRGFGGRLTFHEKDEKKPIIVEGQLVIYAFDETGREVTDNKPTRRYVFPPDQVPLHMSTNEAGPSYSFFLPWDEAGGPRTEVSLICRFEPADGPVVTGEQMRQQLPGTMVATTGPDGKQIPPKLPEGIHAKPAARTLQNIQAKRTEEQATRLASYEAPVLNDPQTVAAAQMGQPAPGERRMTSTTINLPGSFQMPNAAAVAAAATLPAQQYVPQQFVPNQQPIAMPQVQQQQPPQQATVIRPFTGNQPTAPTLSAPVAYGQPANAPTFGAQPPVNSQVATVPPTQMMVQAPASYSTTATAQLPGQQQAQQATQQAVLQQQFLQQQAALQRRMMQQAVPPQQALPQVPAQNNSTATINYPAATQLAR